MRKKDVINKNRTIVYLAGFLFSIPLALTSYINSSFLEEHVGEFNVSILYITASLMTIIIMLSLKRVLERIGDRKTAIYIGVLFFLGLLGLSLGTHNAIISLSFILYFISFNIMVATLDVFVEDFSKDAGIGKFRGMYLMILSMAWVVAQVLSGSIITKSSYKGIYLFSSLFVILFIFIFSFLMKEFKDPEYKRGSVLKTLKSFWRKKSLRSAYLINLILKFFYAWMIIYTPVYLHEIMQIPWNKIGLIFSIMLMPFVLLPYPLGRMSDTRGEKKILLSGFLVSALFTLVIPLIVEPNIWLWAFILFMTRVGASMIETMSESYFFKLINEQNADEISFFRNTSSVSFIIAPIFAIPILSYAPSFKYIFFVLTAVLLLGFYITLRIRDIK